MNNFVLDSPLESSWHSVLSQEFREPYFLELAAFLKKERAGLIPVFPVPELVFNAFYQTPFDKVKVVIIGQDPYHSPHQAHGLSFSVPVGCPLPPSLQNIFKELRSDLGIQIPSHGCLKKWAEQGVMLLNASLTVRQGEPMSHHGKGWERFTDAVVKALINRSEPVIFVLWGNSAIKKCRFLNHKDVCKNHIVLSTSHPSPLGAYRGFFGSRHFSKINEILVKGGSLPINWALQ